MSCEKVQNVVESKRWGDFIKQFIYLDSDIINSIISQAHQGLISELGNEQTDTSIKAVSKAGEAGLKATAGGSFFKLAKAEADLSIGVKLGNESQTQSATKEIVSKILHDASFDIAYEEIKDCIKQDNTQDVGDYVELSHVFDFVDLEYLQELFSEGGFINYLKKNNLENIESKLQETAETLPRDQQRRMEAARKKEAQKKAAESNKQYDDILDIVKAIRKIVPYKRMLVSDAGFLLPLEDKYFRVNPSTIGFKYGGQITAIGLVTNVINPNSEPLGDQNIFTSLQYSVNVALRSFLSPSDKENLYIVHPIAAFYGE